MNKPENVKKLIRGIEGPVVAMTTSFNKDMSIDFEGLKTLTDYYADKGIKNVIAAGSTGEFFSLTDEERKQVIKTVTEQSAGRMTVIGCAAHSGTQLTIDLAKYCQDIGCDAVMVTPPYYSFSDFEGLKKHYQMISDAIDIGIVVYFSGSVLRFPAIQKLIGENWSCPSEILELASIPQVCCIKDASGNYGWYRDISMRLDGENEIANIIGSDGMGYHFWGHNYGSRSFITGIGNMWPEVELDFFDKLKSGKTGEALQIIKDKEISYLRATKETGKYWSCVKYLLNEMGLPGGYMRPPLLDLNDLEKKSVKEVVISSGLLKK